MNQTGATLSDYELTQALGRGAISSIGDLYERYKPLVYAMCLRMTRDACEAEDLTQEIFVQLLLKAGTFRGESQFSTWLYRFTTNHVLMYFRRMTRSRKTFAYLEDEFKATHNLAVACGTQSLDRIALDAALAKLPAGSRSVFLKYDVEGYNHDEIAGIFGCSTGNSKSQLHKARRRLRKLLTPRINRISKNPVTRINHSLRTPIKRIASIP